MNLLLKDSNFIPAWAHHICLQTGQKSSPYGIPKGHAAV